VKPRGSPNLPCRSAWWTEPFAKRSTKVLAKATVLACNLAFNKVVEQEKADGVFGVFRAQEVACHYILAS